MELILDELLETYEEEMQEALKALVRIPSVIDMDSAEERAPYGQPLRKALDKVAEIGEELGFEVKDYDGHVVTVCYGDQGQEVGVLSHVDIVPAGCGWNTDPFDPVVMDGKMFGRGTIDDKGPMVAVLYAMKAIKESKLPIRNHVKLIIGCDEETDHRCVRYYFSKEKSPDFGFSPDASFSVIHGEKAIIWFKIIKEWDKMDQSGLHIQKIEAGTAVNAVPNMARVWLNDEHGHERELQYAGVSAHAMQPWAGENAIVKMVEDFNAGKEIVYGVRSSRATDTWFKRTTAHGFYSFQKSMGLETVYDHADYRLMSNRALHLLSEYKESNLFLRGIIPQIGLETSIVTYERKERIAGESKYPLSKLLSFSIDGITSFSAKPIRMIFMLGLILLLIDIGVGIYVLISYFSNTTISGWASLMLSVWFLGSLILMSIGVVGEYIGKIFIEVKQRPRFAIKDTLLD